MNISQKTRKPRTRGLSIVSRGLLLYVAQHLDRTGEYREYDLKTAEADGNDSTKPTIQRHRQQLLDDGYLFERHPKKWTNGRWSAVGVTITPKGMKELTVTGTVSQVYGSVRPDSRESYNSSIDSCVNNVSDSTTDTIILDDKESVSRESGLTVHVQSTNRDITLPWMSEPSTFAASELPVLVKPDSRITLATNEHLLKFLTDFEYFESVLQADGDSIITRLSPAGLWTVDTLRPNARIEHIRFKEELRKEYEQATFEANAGLFDDKQQAKELALIEQANRNGLGYLEDGELLGGRGREFEPGCSYYYEPALQMLLLSDRMKVRLPRCECGQRVQYRILESEPGERISLGSSHRPGSRLKLYPQCRSCLHKPSQTQSGVLCN